MINIINLRTLMINIINLRTLMINIINLRTLMINKMDMLTHTCKKNLWSNLRSHHGTFFVSRRSLFISFRHYDPTYNF